MFPRYPELQSLSRKGHLGFLRHALLKEDYYGFCVLGALGLPLIPAAFYGLFVEILSQTRGAWAASSGVLCFLLSFLLALALIVEVERRAVRRQLEVFSEGQMPRCFACGLNFAQDRPSECPRCSAPARVSPGSVSPASPAKGASQEDVSPRTVLLPCLVATAFLEVWVVLAASFHEGALRWEFLVGGTAFSALVPLYAAGISLLQRNLPVEFVFRCFAFAWLGVFSLAAAVVVLPAAALLGVQLLLFYGYALLLGAGFFVSVFLLLSAVGGAVAWYLYLHGVRRVTFE